MKYIAYDIAERYLKEACEYVGSNGGIYLKVKFKEEPTIEIVRCKDCKHFVPQKTMMWCDKGLLFVRMDDYCSWGVPKDGDEE